MNNDLHEAWDLNVCRKDGENIISMWSFEETATFLKFKY